MMQKFFILWRIFILSCIIIGVAPTPGHNSTLFACEYTVSLAAAILLLPQVQEMEGARHAHSSQAMEEMEAVKRENEELKEVLSAVQLDLEAKTEVKHNWKGACIAQQLSSCIPLIPGVSATCYGGRVTRAAGGGGQHQDRGERMTDTSRCAGGCHCVLASPPRLYRLLKSFPSLYILKSEHQSCSCVHETI